MMSEKTKRDANRRQYARKRTKEAVRKMHRIAERLAEDSVAMEFPPAAIKYIHDVYDLMTDIVYEVERLEDQGQLKLF